MYADTLLMKALAEMLDMEFITLKMNAFLFLKLQYLQEDGKLEWLPNAISSPSIVKAEMLDKYLDCVSYHSVPYVFRIWFVSDEEKDEGESEGNFWWSLTRHGATLDEGGDHFASTVEGCILAAKSWFEANIE